jgi:hypothetical protein
MKPFASHRAHHISSLSTRPCVPAPLQFRLQLLVRTVVPRPTRRKLIRRRQRALLPLLSNPPAATDILDGPKRAVGRVKRLLFALDEPAVVARSGNQPALVTFGWKRRGDVVFAPGVEVAWCVLLADEVAEQQEEVAEALAVVLCAVEGGAQRGVHNLVEGYCPVGVVGVVAARVGVEACARLSLVVGGWGGEIARTEDLAFHPCGKPDVALFLGIFGVFAGCVRVDLDTAAFGLRGIARGMTGLDLGRGRLSGDSENAAHGDWTGLDCCNEQVWDHLSSGCLTEKSGPTHDGKRFARDNR